MKNRHKVFYCIICLLLFVAAGNGQQTGSIQPYVKVQTTDGTELFGHLVSENQQRVIIATKSMGEVTIERAKIKTLEIIDEASVKNGAHWFPNPNSTRYFFGPSAMNLKAGEGYYQNNYLLLNSFNVGITDNISIGGGFELISTFAAQQPIFYITPKIGFELAENVHAGGGVLYASFPSFGMRNRSSNRSGLGIGYGVFTYGNADNNLTAGGGYGFVNGELSDRPIITLSGMIRIGRSVSFITENWFVPSKRYEYNPSSQNMDVVSYQYMGIISYGVRFFGKNLSVDLGFLNNKEISSVILIGIPYVDFVVKFGKKS